MFMIVEEEEEEEDDQLFMFITLKKKKNNKKKKTNFLCSWSLKKKKKKKTNFLCSYRWRRRRRRRTFYVHDRWRRRRRRRRRRRSRPTFYVHIVEEQEEEDQLFMFISLKKKKKSNLLCSYRCILFSTSFSLSLARNSGGLTWVWLQQPQDTSKHLLNITTLLQGDPNISNNMNSLIFKAVQDFITQSGRFAMEWQTQLNSYWQRIRALPLSLSWFLIDFCCCFHVV